MSALSEYQKYAEQQYVLGTVSDAAIDSLKCCGNCGHFVCDLYCKLTEDDDGNLDGVSGSRTQCLFPDSMWQERPHG